MNGSGRITDDMLPGLDFLKNSYLKNKILVENFTFLSVLQVANLLLFIITIPYLFRVLGSGNYGLVVFAQTIVFYFSIFINYGFNLTATRDISVNRDSINKVGEIVSSVLTIKLIFFLVSFGFMVFLTMMIPIFRENRMLFLFSMLAGLSEAMFPVWYFQGIEKMKYITSINIFTRALATIFVFILINKPSDYYYYPLIVGSGTVLGALIALYILRFRHNLVLRLQAVKLLMVYIKENMLYFVSNVSTQLYINANKLLIGSFLGMVEVAYYDLADKVVNIAKVPLSILGQTLFPRVARDRNLRFLKRIMVFTVTMTVILIFSLFLFSGHIIHFFSGGENAGTVSLLKILSLTLLPISFGLFYGDLLLINFGLKVEYTKMRFFGLVLYLSIFLGLYIFDYLSAQNIAMMVVLVEVFLAVYSYILCRRAGIG